MFAGERFDFAVSASVTSVCPCGSGFIIFITVIEVCHTPTYVRAPLVQGSTFFVNGQQASTERSEESLTEQSEEPVGIPTICMGATYLAGRDIGHAYR